jgi:hypothetical protein
LANKLSVLTALLNYFEISKETFAQAFGSAVGGFIGVVLFFGIRFLIELLRSRPRLVRTYACVTNLNNGGAMEMSGEFQHHRGNIVDDRDALKKLGASNPVWEWSRNPTKAGTGEYIFYGPYSMDPTEPGLYEATFKIRGIGFQKPKEISKDWDILLLDVLRTNKATGVVPAQEAAKVVQYQYQEVIARQTIRVSNLTRSGWKNYTLRFYSDGKGLWEYRSAAFDGIGQGTGSVDLLKNCGTEVRIYFDTVSIKQISKLALPWG